MLLSLAMDMSHRMVIALVLLYLHYSSGFLITEAEPGVIRVAPGDTVTLFCAVDDDYEWCKFYHPSGSFCDFEWKRSKGNITRQTCGLSDRVSFHGKYDDRECGITFTATEEDTGIWKCEIEEYVTWRSRGAGRIQTAQMNVTVHAPTTTATPLTSTTLRAVTAKVVTTTIMSTTPSSAIVSTIRVSKTTLSTTRMSSTMTYSKQTSDSVKSLDDKNPSKTPEAVPRVDEKDNSKASGSSSTLVSVFVVIIVIVVVVLGGRIYRRRKNRSTAAMVFDREAKLSHDQTQLVHNSSTKFTFHSNNLHEYHPPNLTYSTTTPESEA
eukprot:GFUD01066336.1.p1 GENE.GFUD01066336.1~~GFUD01066336.1.p1  ORF type:complete len:323 (+),score=74.31 GFUD01066336.1:142-1110(+)